MATPDVLDKPQLQSTGAATEQPYRPSWVDQLSAWVDRLSVPQWLCYLGLWLALVLLYSAVKWWDGAYPVGTFHRFHLLLTGTSVYAVALMHYLDHRARVALATFRPVLTLDVEGSAALLYRLTTLPARPTFWVTILIGLWRGPYFLYHPDLFAQLKLGTSTVALTVEIILFCLMWGAIGAFVYHTFHQLRAVNHIYSQCTRVNLFQLGPLYAFSHLTAATALGILFPGTIWAIAEQFTGFPLLLSETTLFFSLVALLTFLWPLRSAHAALAAAKQRHQDETGQRLANTFLELDRRVDAGEIGDLDQLKTAIDTLRTQQEVVAKISTWPWQLDTLRGVITAAALPLALWVIQRVLERFVFGE
jgi:hypothetical protein